MLPRNNKTQQERRTEEINQKEPKLNIFKVEQPTPQKPIENKMIKNEKDNMDKPRKYIPLNDVLQQWFLRHLKKNYKR